jgi:hypothetical protein
MFLTPRFGSGLGARYSGRALLTAGLATTTAGNLFLYATAAAHASYAVFAIGMLIAGIGAGLLNSETAKVMQGAVPAQRAGMASGISATTRFVGLLVGVAALGAVLSIGVTSRFSSSAAVSGLDADLVARAAKRVASGDLDGVIGILGTPAAQAIHAAAADAFASGFAQTSLIAAIVAAVCGLLTFLFVRVSDTAPVTGDKIAELAPAME